MSQKIISQEVNKLPEQEGKEPSFELKTIVEHTVVVKKSELEVQLQQRELQLQQVQGLKKEVQETLEKIKKVE